MLEAAYHESFLLLCLFLIWVAVRGTLGGRAVFEFPTIAAFLGLAWVVPQGIELAKNPKNIYGSEAFWLYVLASFALIYAGFHFAKKRQFGRTLHEHFSEAKPLNTQRLVLGTVAMALMGLVSVMLMGLIDTSKMGTQWTGVITMYALFAKASGLALCLSVLIYARTGSKVALVTAIVAAAPIFTSAVYGVRREQVFDLFVLTFGAWYMTKRRSPSPVLVIAALLIGTIVLNSAANLREYVASGKGPLMTAMADAETYTEFDYTNLGQRVTSEVGLAQYDHWYMTLNSEWELGAEYWNAMANQYVPAFLLGREFKEGLSLKTLSKRLGTGETRGMYSFGSTRTGFSDTYRSFGVLGALVFFGVGYFFGYLYAKSSLGSIQGEYFYLSLLAEGLKSITHGTSEFFAALPFIFLISFVVFRFAVAPIHEIRKLRPAS